MGLRFRKSIKVGDHSRVTVSKSGVGFSTGVKGVRFTRTANGRNKVSTSIPGTGLSYEKYIGGKKSGKKSAGSGGSNTVAIVAIVAAAVVIVLLVVLYLFVSGKLTPEMVNSAKDLLN
mgnify:CR=1 FL=1